MLRDSDLVHFFEDGTKLKTPEIIPLLKIIYLIFMEFDRSLLSNGVGLIFGLDFFAFSHSAIFSRGLSLAVFEIQGNRSVFLV